MFTGSYEVLNGNSSLEGVRTAIGSLLGVERGDLGVNLIFGGWQYD